MTPSHDTKPNIVFILLDNIGWVISEPIEAKRPRRGSMRFSHQSFAL